MVTDIRAFVPCKDIEISKVFYEALGFTLSPAGDALYLGEFGECTLFLQRFYQRELAENFVLQIIVDDISEFSDKLSLMGESARYQPVKQESWGKVIYLWGPSGELLQLTQLNE